MTAKSAFIEPIIKCPFKKLFIANTNIIIQHIIKKNCFSLLLFIALTLTTQLVTLVWGDFLLSLYQSHLEFWRKP